MTTTKTSFQPSYRKIGRLYEASLFGVVGERRPTKSEASAALFVLLNLTMDRMQDGIKILVQHDITIVLHPDLNSWSYTLIPPTHRTVRASVPGDLEAVESAARHHAAQMAWHTNVEDDWAFLCHIPVTCKHVSREMRRWIAWQRDFARLEAGGADKRTAHDRAQADRFDLLRGVAVRSETPFDSHWWSNPDHDPAMLDRAACGQLLARTRMVTDAPTCPRCAQLWAQREYAEV